MLKKQILTLCALFAMVIACSKKDKDNPPPVNAIVKAIQDYFSQTENLKTFGNSFQTVTFADADVSTGLTVFAPANAAIAGYDPNARVDAASLTAGEVKDHVVKGIFKKADLTHGKKLTALSGKELVITVDGDKIMVNGVLILDSKEEATHVIYTMDNVLCKKPGAAEITVLDGTQWSTTDTLGKATAGADVMLYYSRNDFQNNQPAAATGKTDASGKITFANLPAGTYYLVAKKDDKYNYIEPTTYNGELLAYKPLGIYQNANQLNTLPRLPGSAIGDFIFLDANMDGIINSNDKTWIPFEVVVTSNKTVQVKSLIGYLSNQQGAPFASKADAQQYLDNLYPSIGNWYQLQTVMDGILSDDADCSTLTSFCSLNNFTLNATNTYTTSLWQVGYSYISKLNRLIINVPALNLSATEANTLIAQAKGLRGFIYLELATYYGGLPLQSGITDYNLSRSSLTDTYTFIKNDLTAAAGILPNKFTGADNRRISADACKLLLARVAMAQGDYTKAKQLTGELIQNATYSLVTSSTIFASDNNAEIIWNINTGFVSAYSSFYNDGNSKTFSPVARYAEVLLINTEARVNMNELDATYINDLLTRRSQSTVTFSNASQARDIVWLTWKNELSREGQRFAKLVKWGTAMQVLGASGFKEYNGLLPIPQYLINQNPNIYQNAGY